ncbi:MAG: orotate phosphoribosyltransferase [Gammaproteobacteria bacterium]|nr:orotate phosphoribosyltransferase [Gammaproteobacteria bacterium]MCP4091697.1 orotate phosphoribosyltransferase [Gammaproteobacteria bacterium]MCP4275004.1 orotate phosphoribosyltransferase [Gammaproteobacteria bacterium]MCP4831827.1 orotate phosphoribosyltransferase [Gammaproteobacteria bacterium]MCP4929763.1 orotate phosphoribosyltransferase [Gammaproteobacteria bacterium]
MQAYKTQFINLALEVGALKFGEFKLKSGRISPYFFNSGMFSSGKAAATMAHCYAETAISADIEFNLIFGPAYKGIPLAALTAAALANQYDRDMPYCFNRKEAKQHGEGGNIVGAAVSGNVLIIDDVITAGTAIREAIEIIQTAGGKITGVLLALDRQEKGTGDLSAVQEVEQQLGIPVLSIIQLADLIEHLNKRSNSSKTLAAMHDYRARYGT